MHRSGLPSRTYERKLTFNKSMMRSKFFLVSLIILVLLAGAAGVLWYFKVFPEQKASGGHQKKNGGVTTLPNPPAASGPQGEGSRLTVSGSTLLDSDGQEVQLRGFNWGGFNPGMVTENDPADIAKMGATVVRIPLRWRFADDSKQDQLQTTAPGHVNPAGLALLDKQIAWAASQKLWVVLFIGSDPDWKNQSMLDEYPEVWKFLAEHYKDTSSIAGYEILSEPHPHELGSSQLVKDFYQKNIAAIRSIDAKTPIIIGPAAATDCTNGPYDVRCLENIYLPNTPNLIYTFNFYEPAAYVKGKDGEKSEDGDGTYSPYPGTFTDRKTNTQYYLDRTWINNLLQNAARFKEAHNVPLFVNQIGVPTLAPGSDQYTRDAIGILNSMDIGYTWWKYRDEAVKHSKYEGGRGVVWDDKSGQEHVKQALVQLFTELFKQGK